MANTVMNVALIDARADRRALRDELAAVKARGRALDAPVEPGPSATPAPEAIAAGSEAPPPIEPSKSVPPPICF